LRRALLGEVEDLRAVGGGPHHVDKRACRYLHERSIAIRRAIAFGTASASMSA
jgi:hypothetical protein